MPIFKEMKRNLFFTAILVASAFTLFSCDIIDIKNDKPSDKAPAPGVTFSTAGTLLNIGSLTEQDVEYLNIFRYEAKNSSKDSDVNKDTITNIGEIFIYNNKLQAFSFIDKYTSKSKYYKYEIRYKTSRGYVYSELSNTPVRGIRSGSDAERPLILKEGLTRLTGSYDSNQYVITVPSDSLSLPDTTATDTYGKKIKFNLMIAISNASVTNLFKMTEDTANKQYTISLRSNLPVHFYDRTLTVSNLVGQYTESDYTTGNETPDYDRVFWTQPKALTLKQNGTDNNKFEIKSIIDSYTIMDYTPQANASAKSLFVSAEDLSADTIYCDYN